MLKVAIVEDSDTDREQLRRLIAKSYIGQLAGQFADGETALDALPELLPDICLVDLGLMGMDGVELISALSGRAPTVRCLGMSGDPSFPRGNAAIRAGAYGFIYKWPTISAFVEKLDLVSRGYMAVEMRYVHLIPEPLVVLKPQCRDVLTLAEQGLTQKEIAARLNLSEDTVFARLKMAREELGAKSTAQALHLIRKSYGKPLSA